MRGALVKSRSDPQELRRFRRLTDSTTVLLLLPRQDVMSSIIFLSLGHYQILGSGRALRPPLTYIVAFEASLSMNWA